jgi:hypothetical protein
MGGWPPEVALRFVRRAGPGEEVGRLSSALGLLERWNPFLGFACRNVDNRLG